MRNGDVRILQMFVEIHRDTALPFVLGTVGEDPQQPPISRAHGFDEHEFIWVKEGSGTFCVGDDRFVLQAGEGVFMRADLPHKYEGDGVFYTRWVTFSMSDAALDWLGVPSYMRFDVPTHLDRETVQLGEYANGNSTLMSRSSTGYAYVMELFSAILESKESTADRVTRFLERRYVEPLTLDDIALEAGMDRFALCRYYKQARGLTVMEELKRIRIEKAKRFLKYSADSVETVGRLCGFESAGYFCKRFRETVGCPPNEYRKRYSGK